VTVRRCGDFGYQLVGGFIEHDPSAGFHDIQGVPPSMSYLFGSLRSTDGDDYWWPIRGFLHGKARHLQFLESKSGGDFEWNHAETDGAYMGDTVSGERDGRWGFWTPGGEPILSTTATEMHWHEPSGVLDVRATAHGPSMQFYCANPEEPLVYTSRLFKVDAATVKGSPCSGWFFHDVVSLREGQSWYGSPYLLAIQGAWVAFVTEMADGSVDAGHLVWGPEGFELMVVQRSDGTLLVDREVTIDYEMDDQDFPSRVSYCASTGETWVWHETGRARMPVRHEISPHHRWREGVVLRDGETREWRDSEALMETYNDRLPGWSAPTS
jgi:hypothetical protein